MKESKKEEWSCWKEVDHRLRTSLFHLKLIVIVFSSFLNICSMRECLVYEVKGLRLGSPLKIVGYFKIMEILNLLVKYWKMFENFSKIISNSRPLWLCHCTAKIYSTVSQNYVQMEFIIKSDNENLRFLDIKPQECHQFISILKSFT